VQINNQQLNEGNGLAVDEPGYLRIHAAKAAELLLFNLAE
jgi:hypothetical protein